MTAFRDRTALCCALLVSGALHVAALAGLARAFEAGPSDARRAGGGGLIFVELAHAAGTSDRSPAAGSPAPGGAQVGSAPARASAAPPSRVALRRAATPAATSRGAATPDSPVTHTRAPQRRSGAANGLESRVGAAFATASGPTRGLEALHGMSGSTPAPGSGGNAPLWQAARPASDLRPHYPDGARERGDEAEVVVEAWVAANGRVERARVRTSAGREFDSAALAAVRNARFHPAQRDGQPVRSVVAMRLHFAMER